MTAAHTARPTRFYLYAILSGALGCGLLIRFLTLEHAAIDLAALLPITIAILVISYLRVPICQRRCPEASSADPIVALWTLDLAMDSAFFCGAALARGLAFGGWTAFVAGLITPMIPSLSWSTSPSTQRVRLEASRGRWIHSAALGLLNGGKNVIALTIAWAAYQGLGGPIGPVAISPSLALALTIMFVLLVLFRDLWTWPALVFLGESARDSLEALYAPGKLLVEVCPLPISLLVSSTLTELGWGSFLLLALAIIGLGAVLRQFAFTTKRLHEEIDLLCFAGHVQETLAKGPQTIDGLCSLAHQLCTEVVSPDRLQIGLYNGAVTQTQLWVTVERGDRIPPTMLPLTPLWDWLSQNGAPRLIQLYAEAADLSIDLPPIGSQASPESALLVPIPDPTAPTTEDTAQSPHTEPELADEPSGSWAPAITESPIPLGAIVIQSVQPAAFDASQLARVVTIAAQVGKALRRLDTERRAPP